MCYEKMKVRWSMYGCNYYLTYCVPGGIKKEKEIQGNLIILNLENNLNLRIDK